MRVLSSEELQCVAGGVGQCTLEDAAYANNYNGVSNTSSFGSDLINLYEGLVQATSHVIERVANAL